MKRLQISSSILAALLVLLLSACKSKDSGSVNAAKPAMTSTNENSDKTSSESQPSTAATNTNASKSPDPSAESRKEPPQLIGTYAAIEVEDKGVVTMISQIKTVISFSASGTYSRASQAKGKIYHSDSGQFRIEPPNKLVLTIQTSRKTILKPSVEKTHTYSLSADGDELRLTSDKGTTAVFHRVSKPKGS
jgi:hypothetical protein